VAVRVACREVAAQAQRANLAVCGIALAVDPALEEALELVAPAVVKGAVALAGVRDRVAEQEWVAVEPELVAEQVPAASELAAVRDWGVEAE
jgi:hypothetical protein